MKKQYFLYLFMGLFSTMFFTSCKKDKIAPANQHTAFVKYYGHVLDQEGHDVKVLTTEEGATEYLILGSSKSFGSLALGRAFRDMYLIKTDSLGNEIWSRKFGNDTGEQTAELRTDEDDDEEYEEEYDEVGKRLLVLKDGSGYLLAGTRTRYVTNENNQWVSVDKKIILYQVDTDGEKVKSHVHDYIGWSENEENEEKPCCSEELYDIVELDPEVEASLGSTAGKFVIAGSTTRVDRTKPDFEEEGGNDKKDIFAVKLDENFETLWSRAYGFVREDNGVSILVLSNSYAVAGTVKIPQGSSSFVNAYTLVEYNKSSGNVINTQEYESGGIAQSACWDDLNQVITIFGTVDGENLKIVQASENFDEIGKHDVSLNPNGNHGYKTSGPKTASDIVLLPGKEGYLLSATTKADIDIRDVKDAEGNPEKITGAETIHMIKLDSKFNTQQERIMGYGKSSAAGRIALIEKLEAGATTATALGYVLTGTFDIGTNAMVGLVRTNTDLSFNSDE